MTHAARRRGAAAACLALALSLLACSRETSPPGGAITDHPLFAQLGEASVANETRAALVLQPPDRNVQRAVVEVPPEGKLHFGFGVPNASVAAEAAPAHFALTLETDAEAPVVLAQATIDGRNVRQRRWHDGVADLSPWAGRRVTLTFLVTTAPGKGPPPLGAISRPVLVGPAHPSAHPNLLLVSIDTLRARNVSAYGYARETTPFLDAFARRGTLFEDAITTSVTTGPAHMSLFTGRYPVNHGLRKGAESKVPSAVTLAQALSDAGYHTAAFTEDGYILRASGFGDGFDEYTENRGGGDVMKAPGEVRITFPQARRWLEGHAREPFFLFVHTYQVHSPYLPPPEYAQLFADGAAPPGPEEPQMQELRDAYDREIRFVDDELRKLIGTLEKSGALARTLVIVVSDHGEEFREHGYFQHGGAVYEEALRVPMIFVGPGVPVDRRVPAPVSLIDVLPTALALLDVPPPPGMDGTSLLGAIRGDAGVPERVLFAEAFAPRRWVAPFYGEAWNPPLVAVRAPEGKFIVHRPTEGEAQPPQAFDLAHDAWERHPRPLEGALRARVDGWVDDYLRGRLAPHEVPTEKAIEPEIEERLRALGYL